MSKTEIDFIQKNERNVIFVTMLTSYNIKCFQYLPFSKVADIIQNKCLNNEVHIYYTK